MSKKLKIEVLLATLSGYDLDGKLSETIKKLQSYIDSNPNLFDFQFDVQTESGWYGECSTIIRIKAYRMETDDEFNVRIYEENSKKKRQIAEAKLKAEKDAIKERQLYEALKRKFEKEINDGK